MQIDADVVICSSSGWAHGVRTTGRKVVYCYAPARWLYQTDAYLARSGALTRCDDARRCDRRCCSGIDVPRDRPIDTSRSPAIRRT